MGLPSHPWDEAAWDRDPTDDLSPDQRAWALHSEALWRKAHAIAADRPDLDVGDVYHSLRTLELPPAERLRRGLTRVRARPHTG